MTEMQHPGDPHFTPQSLKIQNEIPSASSVAHATESKAAAPQRRIGFVPLAGCADTSSDPINAWLAPLPLRSRLHYLACFIDPTTSVQACAPNRPLDVLLLAVSFW